MLSARAKKPMDAHNYPQSTNADDLTFEAWLDAVDRVLLRVVYVTHECLSAWDLRRSWQASMHPAEAAAQLLENDDSSMLVPELVTQLWTAAQQEMANGNLEFRTWRGKFRRSTM
jgi:hypothetical protein